MATKTHNNPKRSPEQKQQQRESARIERQQVVAEAGPVRHKLPVYGYSHARKVACDVMGVKYKPVPAPRSNRQFDDVTSPFAEDRKNAKAPRSFEILTDSL